jgi:type IV pilus assembly protein PilA
MQDIISRLRAKKDDEGFTLIELLVVVVIIGVLVAIAVPVYLNYREGAADKSAQSDVRGAISTIEQYYTDMNNTYPTGPTGAANKQTASFALTPASTSNSRVTLSAKTEMYYVAPVSPATTYKVCARNTGGSGKYYLYDSATGGSVTASATITATNFATCG